MKKAFFKLTWYLEKKNPCVSLSLWNYIYKEENTRVEGDRI